jgi:hypothetical protein
LPSAAGSRLRGCALALRAVARVQGAGAQRISDKFFLSLAIK